MSDRKDYYYRQLLSESELDAGFDALEVADRALAADFAQFGITSGLSITQQIVADGTVICALGTAYDKTGKRIHLPSNQNVDLTRDFNGASTAVAGAGNTKALSIFAFFDRSLTDPRVDGNSITVYFNRAETFALRVKQSTEAVSPTRVSLDSEAILLADVRRTFGQTTFASSDIFVDRRETLVTLTAGTQKITRGNFRDAIGDLLGYYNDHIDGVADKHNANVIMYGGGNAWQDGSTNPAATVEAQLDKLINDLRSSSTGVSGAAKIGSASATNTNGSTTLALTAGSILSQFSQILGLLTSIVEVTGVKALPIVSNTSDLGPLFVTSTRIRVCIVVNDEDFGLYVWLPGSTAPLQDHFIIATTTGETGRWLNLATFLMTQGGQSGTAARLNPEVLPSQYTIYQMAEWNSGIDGMTAWETVSTISPTFQHSTTAVLDIAGCEVGDQLDITATFLATFQRGSGTNGAARCQLRGGIGAYNTMFCQRTLFPGGDDLEIQQETVSFKRVVTVGTSGTYTIRLEAYKTQAGDTFQFAGPASITCVKVRP